MTNNMDYKKVKGYGFVEPQITPDNWVLGAEDEWEIINPTGDWSKSEPKGEDQRKNIETFNCTAFATTNAVEEKDDNYSDRALGIFAGTRPPGNDPHIVAEAARKEGLVQEKTLPFDVDTIDEYYSYPSKEKEVECVKEGQEWVRQNDFQHKWVWNDKFLFPSQKSKLLKDGLTRGKVCVAVKAWEKRNGIYVKEIGESDTHWAKLSRFDESGRPVVFDSYPEDGVYYKTLQKDYDFGYAKVYRVKKREISLPDKNWLIDILKKIVLILRDILKK